MAQAPPPSPTLKNFRKDQELKGVDVDWLLKQLQLRLQAPSSSGGKMDGGKESGRTVAGPTSAGVDPQQKDQKSGAVQQPVQQVAPPPSPSVQQPPSTDQPVPDQQSALPNVGLAQGNPLLGGLDPTDPDAFAVLRKLAAAVDGPVSAGASKLGHSGEGPGGSYCKYFYERDTDQAIPLGANPATTSYNTPLNIGMLAGTGYSDRLGNTVKFHHLEFKWHVANKSKKQDVTNTYDLVPHVNILIVRDKLPTSVGVAPLLAINGSNPPAAVKVIFDGLGLNVSTTPSATGMGSLMVRNPLAKPFFHIHKHIRKKLTPTNSFGVAATVDGAAYQPANSWFGEESIPLDFKTTYQTNGNILINALYLFVWIDAGTTATGAWNLIFGHTAQLSFTDVQDD